MRIKRWCYSIKFKVIYLYKLKLANVTFYQLSNLIMYKNTLILYLRQIYWWRPKRNCSFTHQRFAVMDVYSAWHRANGEVSSINWRHSEGDYTQFSHKLLHIDYQNSEITKYRCLRYHACVFIPNTGDDLYYTKCTFNSLRFRRHWDFCKSSISSRQEPSQDFRHVSEKLELLTVS